MRGTSTEQYKKNFIKQVIFRVDYSRNNEMNLAEKGVFFETIKSKFPKFNELKNQAFEFETATNLENFSLKKDQSLSWEFLTEDGENRVVIDKGYLIFETKNYTNFNSFFENISFLLNTVFAAYTITDFSRLGLRYVNIIELKKGNPLDWNDLISEKILVVGNKFYEKLNKSMHLLEYKNDKGSLRFQYGLFNSEHPAPIARKEFVLDFDCFTTSVKDKEDAIKLTKEFHSIIKKLFENSLGKKLRKVMENGKE